MNVRTDISKDKISVRTLEQSESYSFVLPSTSQLNSLGCSSNSLIATICYCFLFSKEFIHGYLYPWMCHDSISSHLGKLDGLQHHIQSIIISIYGLARKVTESDKWNP